MRHFPSYLSILALTMMIFLVSCKSDSTNQLAQTPVSPPALSFAELEANYQSTPNPSNGNALINALMQKLKSPSLPAAERTQFLNRGYEIATTQGITSRSSGFLFSILKEGVSAPTPDKLMELGTMMKAAKKDGAANVLFSSIAEKNPNWEKLEEVKSQISETFADSDAYLASLGEALFKDVDNTGINRTAAMKYVNACEAYGLAFPERGDVTADNLFKAAEVAKSIRTFPKSLSIYDWILDKYPDYKKAPTSLFLKGFIIENNLKDDAKAREIYDDFLAKYPTHDLADDVEFLIDNLGKSDQEILEMIEQKKKDRDASVNN